VSTQESHTFAYLGPVGTFTEAALKKITCDTDVKIPFANVTAALDAVRNGQAQYALVPIENSVEGVVARTLDELASGDPLTIASEVTLAVTFALMTKPGATTINRIGTHPHAESQCRAYIAANYPHAEIVPTASTSAAAEAVSKGELMLRLHPERQQNISDLKFVKTILVTMQALSLDSSVLKSLDGCLSQQETIAPQWLSLSISTMRVRSLKSSKFSQNMMLT